MKMFGMAVMWATGRRPRRTRLRDSRLPRQDGQGAFPCVLPVAPRLEEALDAERARRTDVNVCVKQAELTESGWRGGLPGSMLGYALIGSEERRPEPTVALGVRAEDFRVARGEADRDRAVLAFRLRRAIGEHVHRERDEAHDEHIAPHRADCLHVAIGGRRGPCLRRRGP